MSSPVPAALDALTALWDGAESLRYLVDAQLVKLVVDDGPLQQRSDSRRRLHVGTSVVYPAALIGAQAPTQQRHGFGGRRDESFTVRCVVQAWGGERISPVRAAAYETYEAAEALLVGDRDLGGVVSWARVVQHVLTPVRDGKGAGALLEFTVAIDATRFEEGD